MDAVCPSTSLRTPQRGRSAYPAHLARTAEGPRVPLHRRGTSQKLECFEDLLREAGFKETRVFTPEVERAEAAAEARRKQADARKEKRGTWLEKKGAAGLVDFLSGLVSWSDSEERKDTAETRHAKTQSLGRASGKQKQILLDEENEDAEGTNDCSNVLVTPTPNRRRPFTPIIITSNFNSPGSSGSASSRSPPQMYQTRSSRTKSNQLTTKQSNHFRPDARTALRHMISLPDLPPERATFHPSQALPRRVTDYVSSRSGSLRRKSSRMRSHNSKGKLRPENEAVPPLPQNWLSAIAQAMTSGSSARAGSSSARADSSCHTRNKTRDGGIVRRGFEPRTPRGDTVPGVVTPASVVCRSAPGSRSSSLVRKPSNSTRTRKHRQVHGRDGCLPSLGVTSIQLTGSESVNDEDEDPNVDYYKARASLDTTDDNYDNESSDDGEPNFAQLILPARRQHSIQSLRRHLHNYAAASTTPGSQRPPPSAFINRIPKRNDSQSSFRGRPTKRFTADTLRSQSDLFDNSDEFPPSRRVSADEDTEDGAVADWAAHGLPGLETAVRKKRGALPWNNS